MDPLTMYGLGSLLGGAGSMMNAGSGSWSWRRQDMLNERQFQRETEYNKPINQVKRLREAGLNPNLLYGSISTGNATSGGSSAGSPGGSSFGQRLQALGDTLTSLSDVMGKKQARKEAQQQYKEDRDFLRKDRDLDLQLKQIRINQMTQPTNVYGDNIMDVIGDGVGIFSPRLGNFVKTFGRNVDLSKVSPFTSNPVSNPVSSPASPNISKSLKKYLYNHPKVFDKMKKKGRVYSRFSDL